MGDHLDGPALKDLADNMGTSLGRVSNGYVSYSVSHCLGALLMGLAFRWINRQIGCIISLVGLGLVVFAIPLQRHLMPYLGLQAFVGLFDTALDVALNAWLLEMWQESANPFMQGLHFVSSAGRAAAFLSIPPFLSTAREPSRLAIPFTAISVILCLAALLLLLLAIAAPYQQAHRHAIQEERKISTVSASLSSEPMQRESKTVKTCKFFLCLITGCLLMCFASNIQHLTSFFLPSYAIDVGFSKKTGAVMAGVNEAAYSLGRLFGAFAALVVPVNVMLAACFLLTIAANLLLMFAGSSEMATWIAVVLMGVACSVMYGGAFSLLEQHINVTTMVSSLMIFSSSIASIVMTLALGAWMQSHPSLLLYMNIGSAVSCFLFLAIFYAMDVSWYRERQQQQQQQQQNDAG